MDDKALNELYRLVASEIATGRIDDGLWLRALTEMNHDDSKAKSRYSVLRIEELVRDFDKGSKQKNEILKEARKILKKAAKDTKNFSLRH